MSSIGDREAIARRFFESLWGPDAPGWITLCHKNEGAGNILTAWVPGSDLGEAARQAVALSAQDHVWAGVGLRKERLPSPARGSAEHVLALPGLWADIDVAGPGHKGKELPPTDGDALALIGELGLRPTMVVHSGGGLQAYWLFRELFILENDAERAETQALGKCWERTLDAKARAHGWRLDSTADLARILRVPGSFNRKLSQPRPVKVLFDDGPRYNSEDFEPYLLSDDTPENNAQCEKPGGIKTLTAAELKRLKRALAALSPERRETYADWIAVGMALGELGGVGLQLWQDWSGHSVKNKPGECAAKWATFTPGDGLTLASIFAWADADSPGWRGAGLPQGVDFLCTDLANAKRFAQLAADRLLYVHEWGWLAWDGRRWARDTMGTAERIAREVPAAIYAEAGALPDSTEDRKKLIRWGLASEGAMRRAAILHDGQTEDALRASANDLDGEPCFDADPLLINCLNGTLDLRTGELRPHRPADRLTRLAPVVYRAGATHPLWERYLQMATGGNAEFAAYLQRAAGYSLTGSTKEEVVFLVLGPANTGKTTLAEALLAVLGTDSGSYGQKIGFETLLKARHGGGAARPDIAGLAGVRLAVACEADGERSLDTVTVKELTGGDKVTARFLYKDQFTFRPQVKLWLATNEAPDMPDDDTGLWRRMRRLPFDRVVPEGQRDPQLKQTLINDPDARAAVFAWAVAGCLAWQRQGIGYPGVIRQATAELRAGFDPLGEFFAKCCVFSPSSEVTAIELRQEYVRWAREIGGEPINDNEWSERLKGKGCERKRRRANGARLTYWLGVGLLLDTEQELDTPDTPKGIFAQDYPLDASRSEFRSKQRLSLSGVSTNPLPDSGSGATFTPWPDGPRQAGVSRGRVQEMIDQGYTRAEAERMVIDEADEVELAGLF